MKKTDRKSLPKFKTITLGADELDKVAITGGCTCGTYSSCNADGTDDGDGAEVAY